MKVVMLGRLAEIAGWRDREVSAQTVADLIAVLSVEDPELGAALKHPRVRVVVDQEISDRAVLTGAREVAFLPVVSGG